MYANRNLLTSCAFALLLLLVGSGNAWADNGDFDPVNPPEPNANFTIRATSAYGYVSGGGTYQQGTTAWMAVSSADVNYTFAYWTKNGVRYCDKQNFAYVVEENARFEAVFNFTPVDPSEPVTPNSYRLYLETDLEGSCSFNRTNGEKAEADAYVTLSATPSPGFVFQGWYSSGNKLSGNLTFNYLMPRRSVSVTARFVYSPENPEEPNGNGGQSGNVDNGGRKGDVNGDGSVSTADAVLLLNSYVSGSADRISKSSADVNSDGEVNTADAVLIVNQYVRNQ